MVKGKFIAIFKADFIQSPDLNYRAQLKGWKFIYLEDVKTPAGLPPVMSALKSQ